MYFRFTVKIMTLCYIIYLRGFESDKNKQIPVAKNSSVTQIYNTAEASAVEPGKNKHFDWPLWKSLLQKLNRLKYVQDGYDELVVIIHLNWLFIFREQNCVDWPLIDFFISGLYFDFCTTRLRNNQTLYSIL